MSQFDYPITAFCEACGKLFWGVAGKFCDNPRCRGYLHHIDRNTRS